MSLEDDLAMALGNVNYYEKRQEYLENYFKFFTDLSRNANGRIIHDPDSSDETGFSQGNPILTPGMHIGYTMTGDRIIVPTGHLMNYTIEAWYESPDPA